MRIKLLCIPLFIGACALLYYGGVMLLLVPGNPGESYLKSLYQGRFLYGVLPTLSGGVLLATVGWLWNRSNGSADFKMSVIRTLSYAVAAVFLFWLGLMVVANIRHGFK